jgi:hypothetical protein
MPAAVSRARRHGARNRHGARIVVPLWVHREWDGELHMSYPPSPAAVEEAFKAEPEAKGALVASPTDYALHRHAGPRRHDGRTVTAGAGNGA